MDKRPVGPKLDSVTDVVSVLPHDSIHTTRSTQKYDRVLTFTILSTCFLVFKHNHIDYKRSFVGKYTDIIRTLFT